jgi:hypothetical protein
VRAQCALCGDVWCVDETCGEQHLRRGLGDVCLAALLAPISLQLATLAQCPRMPQYRHSPLCLGA